MAIGGFNGEGGNISLATFEAYVAKGDIHYFIASGAGGGGGVRVAGGASGPGGVRNSDSAITNVGRGALHGQDDRRPDRLRPHVAEAVNPSAAPGRLPR